MDKVKEIEATFNHGISLAERKNVVITGIKKIESFDNEEFWIRAVDASAASAYHRNIQRRRNP